VLTLSTALERTFAGAGQRVVWNLAPHHSGAHDALLRIDSRHGPPQPAGELAAEGLPDSESRPWLVLVENAHEVAVGNRSRQLRSAAEHEGPLLIVVCDVGGRDAAIRNRQPGRGEPAARIASRLRFDYVGPVAATTDTLSDTLERIRQSGRSTVLYLDAQPAALPAPHFTTTGRVAGQSRRLRSIAIEALAELVQQDQPVMAFSTDVDPWLPNAWEAQPVPPAERDRLEFAITHCGQLAEQGKRPYLFLSVDELIDHLGSVRSEICAPSRGVTLVVEARQRPGEPRPSSAHLAAVLQLPDICLLSPKNGDELREMLLWCATHPGPEVIWLPEATEADLTWPHGAPVALGRAECLGSGTDVAIVAWGPATAAAAMAAESLAQRGISTTVVNVRFARPLDVASICRITAQAPFTVIVDDTPAGGGFASWVAEALVRQQVVPNLAIVSPATSGDTCDANEATLRCAADLVERCQWLCEPIGGGPFATPVRAAPPLTLEARTCSDHSARREPRLVGGMGIHQQVLAQQFSPFIERWVEAYERVGTRNVYLWRWCLHGLGLTTLSCVAPELRQDLCDTKLLAVMYGVMLDDVADHAGSDDFLAALTGIIAGRPERDFTAFTPQQQQYALFTCELWDTFLARLQQAPRYQEFAELLDYDHRQILNTFAYSCMVNKHPRLLNVQEHDMYMPHNMQMMSFATMDLMCSPDFDRDEVGRLREVVWHAQSMGRIGNLVSTWQREIADHDFTSGVFARALREGDLTLDDLQHASGQYIEQAIRRGGHERFFLEKWEMHRSCIQQLAAGIRSVRIDTLLSALDRLMQMELQSVGWK
jgi:transketolase C-terminal domain/subunit